MRPTARTSFLALVLVAVAWAGTAHAGVVIHVPGDQPTLAAALTIVSNGGTIELAGGTYASPAGGWSMSNANKVFTIRGEPGADVRLDGSGTQRIFRIMNSSIALAGHVTFEHLTFQNGYSSVDGQAAAVTIYKGRATFVGVAFTGNDAVVASAGSGGILLADSVATFVDCSWDDNTCSVGGGGLSASNATVWLQHCRFTGNRSNVTDHIPYATAGGATVVNTVLRVGNTRFDGNQAGYVGGGLYALGSWVAPFDQPSSDVIVSDCTFVDNLAQPDPSVTLSLPTEAGGIHVEDQSRLRLYSSRLIDNAAGDGGGLNIFRARAEVDDCVFVGNRATAIGPGRGFGGAISAISDDLPSPNRPAAELTVRHSFLQGVHGAVTDNGQFGGCISAHGDTTSGIDATDDPTGLAYNRARLALSDSALVDCDVSGSTSAGGGGIEARFTETSLQHVAIISSDATGSEAGAGAFTITTGSMGTLSDVTVADCAGTKWGGAAWVSGADLDVTDSAFVFNEVSPGTSETINQSYGAALFATQENFSGTPIDLTGTVSGTVFSNNIGAHVFEDDRAAGPINDWRYNGNTFYGSPFSPNVFYNVLVGAKTAPQLNSLVISRDGGVPSTDKSQVDNTLAGSPPRVATLVAAPRTILTTAAAGDPSQVTPAYLAYAWEGGSAHLDAQTVTTHWGWGESTAGSHQLEVDGVPVGASLSTSNGPTTMFKPAVPAITSGASVALQWAVSGAGFLEAWIDHAVGTQATASGSVLVAPTVTTTYTLVAITTEGSVSRRCTVFVDELPIFFSDGFESGDTSRWSIAHP